MGGSSSSHNTCERCMEDLMNPSQHVDKVINRQSQKEIFEKLVAAQDNNRVCLVAYVLDMCFQGHNESLDSKNRGHFIEMVKHIAKFNDEVVGVFLENAPRNAKYTSPIIQKRVLNILANNVRKKIREEVGHAAFCILVDESQDTSNREQMTIVLRFVDNDEIKKVLDFYELCIDKMKGQGYDGPSNMRGTWNGLQALFLSDCPYAYYVHCFAHQVQLALVSASKEVAAIRTIAAKNSLFFSFLNSIVNVITASPKRHSELQVAQSMNIIELLAAGERETVCTVLENTKKDGSTGSLRGEATSTYNAIRQFKFVFILHLLKEIMGLTYILYLFCKKHDIDMPHMNAQYEVETRRSCQQNDNIIVEHHYHFDIFNYFQLAELNSKFSEWEMELLILSSALDPKLHILICELKLYETYVPHHLVLKNVSNLSELCQGLVETKRSQRYYLIDRLIRLVLTLLVSTATTERAFSAMKLVKTALSNKMENEFLADSMIVYI
ncbi:hypothetical protein PRUPE_7G129800 [Prunus persica]|uniref:DUF4371 domain-containing protein n=1 Tax=Prunus persica TaxID=3760 RepID=A0A251NAU6_PRUPE|nr:hypothetical protein PRUPE_7G129800 [Prunus persica]